MRRVFLSRVSTAIGLVVLALASAMVAAQVDGDDGELTMEDLKCQVCDYAVRSWVRFAVLADVECHRLAAKATDPLDAQLAKILPANGAANNLVDIATDCDAGAGVNKDAVSGLGKALCKELFLDEFPYVEEFPADGSIETDRERMWEDPASYWKTTPADDKVEPMTKRDIDMIRKACEATLPLAHGGRRAKLVATIRAAVRAGQFGELEAHIKTTKKDQLAIVVENAEEAAKMKLTSDELEDEAVTEAAVGPEVAKATAEFLLLEKRQAVYDVILAMQRDMCAAACPDDIQRPTFDRRIRGWSATLKRL